MSLPPGAIAVTLPGGGTEILPEEVPVALVYDGITQAVMMATPGDLEDFHLGFALTEGLISGPGELGDCDVLRQPKGHEVRGWLAAPAGARFRERRRLMAGPVGCGLCGIDSLEQALRHPRTIPEQTFAMTSRQIMAATAALTQHQPLHDTTRAAHAAAFWQDGRIIAAREDVGRHNALDKLIGVVRDGRGGALLMTCRISIDLVQKAAAAEFPVMIGASAPTAAAVDMADAAGITLIGLARDDRFEVFTHPRRIAPEESAHVA